MKKKQIKRIIALGLSMVFISQQALFAQTELFARPNTSPEFSAISDSFENQIPTGIGTVIEQFGNRPAVILIQDAHGHSEAQINTVRILEWLDTFEKTEALFIEGGFGNLEAGRLSFSGNGPADLAFARALIDQSDIGGAEYFLLQKLIEEGKTIPAYGLENPTLYFKNLKAYQAATDAETKAEKRLESEWTELQRQVSGHFNPELSSFYRNWLGYAKNEDFPRAFSVLSEAARKHLNLSFQDARLQVEWPMLTRLAELKMRGKKTNLQKTKEDKQRLVVWLNQREGKGSSYFQILEQDKFFDSTGQVFGSASRREFWEKFYMDMGPRGFDFEKYPHLTLWEGARILESELETDVLQKEMSGLEALIFDRLIKTPKEKSLIQKAEQLFLTEKLAALKLTRPEFEAVAQNPQLRKDVLFRNAFNFYSRALLRDRVMAENLERTMTQNNIRKAAAIVGGFHTSGLTSRLKQKNISYAVIRPHLSEIASGQDYRDVVMGKLPTMPLNLSMLRAYSWLNAPRYFARLPESNRRRYRMIQESLTGSRSEVREEKDKDGEALFESSADIIHNVRQFKRGIISNISLMAAHWGAKDEGLSDTDIDYLVNELRLVDQKTFEQFWPTPPAGNNPERRNFEKLKKQLRAPGISSSGSIILKSTPHGMHLRPAMMLETIIKEVVREAYVAVKNPRTEDFGSNQDQRGWIMGEDGDIYLVYVEALSGNVTQDQVKRVVELLQKYLSDKEIAGEIEELLTETPQLPILGESPRYERYRKSIRAIFARSELRSDKDEKGAAPSKLKKPQLNAPEKVVVIGASGFIGHSIFQTLKKTYPGAVGTGFHNAEGLTLLDVTNEKQVNDFIQREKPTVIVYAAGMANPTEAENNQKAAYAVNVEGPKNFVKNFRGRFIYLSTDYIFDGQNFPYQADASAAPLNYYGQTKLEGEKIVLSKPSNSVIRLGLVYGENLPEERNLIQRVVKKMDDLQMGRKTSPVFLDDQQIRHPVWVQDVAKTVVDAVAEKRSGILQLNGEKAMTQYQMGHAVANHYGFIFGKHEFLNPDSVSKVLRRADFKDSKLPAKPKNAQMVNTPQKETTPIFQALDYLLPLFSKNDEVLVINLYQAALKGQKERFNEIAEILKSRNVNWAFIGNPKKLPSWKGNAPRVYGYEDRAAVKSELTKNYKMPVENKMRVERVIEAKMFDIDEAELGIIMASPFLESKQLHLMSYPARRGTQSMYYMLMSGYMESSGWIGEQSHSYVPLNDRVYPYLSSNALVGGSYSSVKRILMKDGRTYILKRAKNAKDGGKLLAEATYMEKLRTDKDPAAQWFPEIYSIQEKNGETIVKMEDLKWPTLSDVVQQTFPSKDNPLGKVFGTGYSAHQNLVSTIQDIYRKLTPQFYSLVQSEVPPDFLEKYHFGKVATRWDEAAKISETVKAVLEARYLELPFLKGKYFPNIKTLMDILKVISKRHPEYFTPPYLSKQHGDLHIGNILVDPFHYVRTGKLDRFKLIDPKYMPEGNDPLYDFAKLIHNYYGHYDLAVEHSDTFHYDIKLPGEKDQPAVFNTYYDDDASGTSLTLSRIDQFIEDFHHFFASPDADNLFLFERDPNHWRIRLLFIHATLVAGLLPFHAVNDKYEKKVSVIYERVVELLWNLVDILDSTGLMKDSPELQAAWDILLASRQAGNPLVFETALNGLENAVRGLNKSARSEVRSNVSDSAEDETEQHHFRVESMIEFYAKNFLLFAENIQKPRTPDPKISRYYSRPAETGPPNIFVPGQNPQHDRRVLLVRKAIEWMKKRSKELNDPAIDERAQRIGRETTVISVSAPTRLFVYNARDARIGVYHISRRRSAIHFPVLYLDSLDPADENHVEELALYLDRAQRWIDAYEAAEKNVRQNKIKLEDVPEIMELDRARFEEQDQRMLGDDKKFGLILERLKALADIDRHNEPERVTEIRIFHETVSEIERNLERKKNPTRDDFYELATYYGRLAHLQENAGSHVTAILSYRKQVKALHQLQVYDTGQLPLKIQKDIIRILLRAGLDGEFLNELKVFFTGYGFIQRENNPMGLWRHERGLLKDEIEYFDTAYATELISVLWEKKSLIRGNYQNAKLLETEVLKLYKKALLDITSEQWELDSLNFPAYPQEEPRSEVRNIPNATVLSVAEKMTAKIVARGMEWMAPPLFAAEDVNPELETKETVILAELLKGNASAILPAGLMLGARASIRERFIELLALAVNGPEKQKIIFSGSQAPELLEIFSAEDIFKRTPRLHQIIQTNAADENILAARMKNETVSASFEDLDETSNLSLIPAFKISSSEFERLNPADQFHYLIHLTQLQLLAAEVLKDQLNDRATFRAQVLREFLTKAGIQFSEENGFLKPSAQSLVTADLAKLVRAYQLTSKAA